MSKRIIVGITGATGVIYGTHILELLKETEYETHLIISEAAKLCISMETNYTIKEVAAMASYNYENTDIAAPLASGSFITDGMIVAPCTIKSLSSIVNSYNANLLVRAADVCLKEKRRLVLMVRETPLHKGHLRLMSMAADIGAHILPPVPSFYIQPKTIQDIIDQTIGKIFDYMDIPHSLFRRWGESKEIKR